MMPDEPETERTVPPPSRTVPAVPARACPSRWGKKSKSVNTNAACKAREAACRVCFVGNGIKKSALRRAILPL